MGIIRTSLQQPVKVRENFHKSDKGTIELLDKEHIVIISVEFLPPTMHAVGTAHLICFVHGLMSIIPFLH